MENLGFSLKPWVLLASWIVGTIVSSASYASTPLSGAQYLKEASELYKRQQYFQAARYAFASFNQDPTLKPDAYAWVTMGLLHAGMPNAASYFFVRTLQSGHRNAIRSVLSHTQDLFMIVGADLLRKYLIRHTTYEDYDSVNRSAYLYSLGKDLLLSGDSAKAIGYLNGIPMDSPIWPYSLQLRGTAHALSGRDSDALQDFRTCASRADQILRAKTHNESQRRQLIREVDDLESRCLAGQARTYYQMEEFEKSDRAYDRIAKKSFVWPDILFEQAWNSFAKLEYNRSLGKLVTYKSPALKFVFNTEIDVLRAQSYLALCLYSDANDVINDFNAKFTNVGVEIKEFVEHNSDSLPAFYDLGKNALRAPLYTSNDFYRLMNRFIRGPYFQSLVSAEHQIVRELSAIRQEEARFETDSAFRGFPGFLEQVLAWRLKTIQLLGGAFVKNSLIDYHTALIEDFEKMAFIKLEMLKKAKDTLMGINSKSNAGERMRGSKEPSRRDDQYRWSFNGEFWNDELGDYVFGLESACQG